MKYRILLVDDHVRWRRVIRSILSNSRRWDIVGEVAGGLDAIRTISTLRPQVILLDVELGSPDGIETARRILSADPTARILFVSAHRSWDIAAAALDTGARGYLLKSDAGHELMPAIETISQGGWFISPGLVGRAARRTRSRERPRTHEAGFYADDTSALDGFARFSATALKARKSVIVVTTESHRHAFHERLQVQGIDLDATLRGGRYFPVNVEDLLAALMVDGVPDEARFWKLGMTLLMQAASGSHDDQPRLAGCGECPSVLIADGRVDAAIRLEQLWDEFSRVCNVDTFCGYSIRPDGSGRGDANIIDSITAVHSAVHLLA